MKKPVASSKGIIVKRDEKTDTYEVHHEYKGAFQGEYIKVCELAILWGVDESEMLQGMGDMLMRGNNVAHFGMFGTFLYSCKN